MNTSNTEKWKNLGLLDTIDKEHHEQLANAYQYGLDYLILNTNDVDVDDGYFATLAIPLICHIFKKTENKNDFNIDDVLAFAESELTENKLKDWKIKLDIPNHKIDWELEYLYMLPSIYFEFNKYKGEH